MHKSSTDITARYPITPVNPFYMSSPLRAIAQQKNFFVGTAVNAEILKNDASYRETLAREFNLVVAENSMKFHNLQPVRGQFDFEATDRIIDFALENNMAVRGHTLLWHRSVPDWLAQGDWSRQEVMNILETHIKTVVGRYRGKVSAWDVANEVLDGKGDLRDSFWRKAIGDDYVEMAFRWAREADPDALLMYNEFDAEGMNAKSDGVYAFVQALQAKGVPIDGIGFQSHFREGAHPSVNDISRNMARLDELGIAVHVTEMDVRIQQSASAAALVSQAETYQQMMQACLDAVNCNTFATWGFSDRYSWIPDAFEDYGRALPFDEDFKPKPTYQELVNTLEATVLDPLGPVPLKQLLVTTLEDRMDDSDGVLSLREAIAFTNDGDTISFAENIANGSIVLTHSLEISKAITLDGQTQNILISGDQFDLIKVESTVLSVHRLDFEGGSDGFEVSGRNSGLNLTRVNIVNVLDDSIDVSGTSAATITLDRTTLNNSRDEGIEVRDSDYVRLTLQNESEVAGASSDGLDISSSSNAVVTIDNSKVSENRSDGLELSLSSNSTITLLNSQFENNQDDHISVTQASNASVHLDRSLLRQSGDEGVEVRDSHQLNVMLTGGYRY